jgi:lysophospholipase L1-like esterase
VVRRALPCFVTLVFACAFFHTPPSFPADAKKKKRTSVPATPKISASKIGASKISAALRAASLDKVSQYLQGSAQSPIEQPGVLVPVFEQLQRMSSAQTRLPVHIIHFGDSHTAADEWTGGLRDHFRQRFGDGGSGFSLAGHPFPGYRRFDARGGGTPGWQSVGGRAASGDGLFGLGGFGIVTGRPGQSVFLNVECDRLEIHYLKQPGGGRLALYDYDQRLADFSTDGELGPGFVRYETGPGAHRFLLKMLDARPVRLFGWVADRDAGVTYEALGLNGAEASVISKWNEAMLATYLQRRNPGLIVLAYGANEASDPYWTHEDYQAMFNSLLQRLRQDVPTASILVLGPADRWWRYQGKWRLVRGIDRIVAAERNACRENGCAFWDTRERMGGAGAMKDWVYAGLGQGDHVHFTGAGYHRLAEVLFADLMQQYDAYKNLGQDGNGKPNQDR